MAPSKQTDKVAEAIIQRHEELLKSPERASIQNLWQEISRYILPHESSFLEPVAASGGTLRRRDLLDSTAMRSLELFASSIHSLMNNPASQWFRMGIAGTEQRKLPKSMQEMLDTVSTEMLRYMTGRSVNIYSHLHTTYLSLGGFGTACLYIGAGDPLLMREFPMADICIDEDANGVIDTVYRMERMTVRQMMQRWPGRVPEDFGHRAEAGSPNDRLEVVHAVFPSTDLPLLIEQNMAGHDMGQLQRALDQARLLPWMSVWINKTDAVTIHIGGFDALPYVIPRWYKSRGEIYGRSPGMTTLPDARMTNRMMETIVRGAEKLVDPPLMLPHGSLISPLRAWPGSITYTDGIVDPRPLLPPGASRVEYGQELLLTRQQAIREGFFTPLFATPDSPVMTATQVLHQADERNRAIAPMLIRMQEELFHPLLFRVFNLLRKAGALSIPGELEGQELDIEYVSPLRAAHKQSEALGTVRIMEQLAPWAGLDPTVLDLFDPESVANIVHSGSGAPADILRTTAQMRAVREQRAEQAAAESRMANVDAVEALAGARTADAAMLKAQKA